MVIAQVDRGTRKSPFSNSRGRKVSVKEAKKHIEQLIKVHGFTNEAICRAAGVSQECLYDIRNGLSKNIFISTHEKIVSVMKQDKVRYARPLTCIKPEKSLHLVEEIHNAGFSYNWIVKQTGWTDFFYAKKGVAKVTVKTARSVKELHDKLWRENTEGFIVRGRGVKEPKTVYSGKTLRQTCHCYDSMLKDDKRKQYTIERDRSARRNRESKDQLMVGTGL